MDWVKKPHLRITTSISSTNSKMKKDVLLNEEMLFCFFMVLTRSLGHFPWFFLLIKRYRLLI
jgi:hypothetical protein